MGGYRRKKTYDKEFKLEAVRLVLEELDRPADFADQVGERIGHRRG